MSIMTQLFEQLIEWNYFFSQDYGIAIVMITLEVRLLLLPLNIRQRKQISRQQEISQNGFYQENGTGMGGCVI